MDDFRKFFLDNDMKPLLSKVESIAMYMNASYLSVVREFLPDVDIVYDRYHMEDQFGMDVMKSVRHELFARSDHLAPFSIE